MTKTPAPRIQWHPVFSKALQIELANDRLNLDKNEYPWLTSLHRGLEEEQQNLLLQEYQIHKEDPFYEEVLSFIATINIQNLRRRSDMCKGLMDAVRPEIEQEKQQAIEQAKPQIIEQTRLDIARHLKDCLDIETIARKLGLSPETVQSL